MLIIHQIEIICLCKAACIAVASYGELGLVPPLEFQLFNFSAHS